MVSDDKFGSGEVHRDSIRKEKWLFYATIAIPIISFILIIATLYSTNVIHEDNRNIIATQIWLNRPIVAHQEFFCPERINFKQGETIDLLFSNKGKTPTNYLVKLDVISLDCAPLRTSLNLINITPHTPSCNSSYLIGEQKSVDDMNKLSFGLRFKEEATITNPPETIAFEISKSYSTFNREGKEVQDSGKIKECKYILQNKGTFNIYYELI